MKTPEELIREIASIPMDDASDFDNILCHYIEQSMAWVAANPMKSEDLEEIDTPPKIFVAELSSPV